jgi:hypothetical protein
MRAGPVPKGGSNKLTRDVKQAILEAATLAGDEGGLVAYLLSQAKQPNPSPFMTMLSKLIPTKEHHNHDGEINVSRASSYACGPGRTRSSTPRPKHCGRSGS